MVIKHNNPCGAATANDLAAATRAALDGDPLSAFGSVLGFNRPVDAATAEVLAEPGRFVEAIVAPDFEPAALEILTTRPKWKANVRLMKVGPLDERAGSLATAADRRRHARASRPTSSPIPRSSGRSSPQRQPHAAQWADLRFAWAIVRHVKSNAIVLAKDARCWAPAPGR